jgi:hypothetical protein
MVKTRQANKRRKIVQAFVRTKYRTGTFLRDSLSTALNTGVDKFLKEQFRTAQGLAISASPKTAPILTQQKFSAIGTQNGAHFSGQKQGVRSFDARSKHLARIHSG